MKLFLLLAAIGLVFGTKAFAGDVKNCSKLKIAGRHECSLGGEKLRLNIQKLGGVLQIVAETEGETFIIDGTERARYAWSNDFTYNSSCSPKKLTINSFNKGQSEGTIQIAPNGSSIEYSISKGAEKLTLSCRKI